MRYAYLESNIFLGKNNCTVRHYDFKETIMHNTSPLTNDYVQEILHKGTSVLLEQNTQESSLTANLLDKLAQRFKSGNSIPSGGGLGLEEAVQLAEFHVNAK